MHMVNHRPYLKYIAEHRLPSRMRDLPRPDSSQSFRSDSCSSQGRHHFCFWIQARAAAISLKPGSTRQLGQRQER